jgi:hypothetical protein
MNTHFPTVQAREKADEAIDKLSENEPMSVYIDTWLAAYVAAGGRTEIKA